MVILRKKALLFIFIIAVSTVTGCWLDTDPPTVPKRVELTFEVDNIGVPLEANGDTLNVEEFKFIIRTFNLITADSETLQTTEEREPFIFGYNTELEGERLILGVDLGFEDFDRFSGYEVFVNRALGEDNLLDPDFYGENENYSLVMSGTFNRDNFLYKSTLSFDKLFEFDNPVNLDDNNVTLWINTLLDLENLFIDSENNLLLNPQNEADREEIETRFQNHLRVEAAASTNFF